MSTVLRDVDVKEHRQPDSRIEPLLYKRWSPRAMSGAAIADAELTQLFEAARWAPSSYNGQPWRFLYVHRDSEHWDQFFDLMGEFNQQWAKNAGVLLVIVSRTTHEHNGKPAPTHSFDTGAAWQNLALQAMSLGLVAHGMEGFDAERAREVLGIPEAYHVEAMAAVGRPGKVEALPEGMRAKEKPSSRKPIEEIAIEGPFPAGRGG